MAKFTKGFTLIELSIVIVIIALIVAGVLAGQGLVKQAQLRSVIKEKEQVESAYNSFRNFYNQLPGDFNNGFAYWDTACAATAADCNGDNNGLIQELPPSAVNGMETYMVWKHLELAGMYPGPFTGQAAPVTFHAIARENVPSSKKPGVGIMIMPGITSLNPSIVFGKGSSTIVPMGPGFSAQEAFSLDEKLDDGQPLEGETKSLENVLGDCYTSPAVPSDYALDSDVKDGCTMYFSSI